MKGRDHTSKYSSPCLQKGALYSTKLKDRNGVPVGQNLASLSLVLDSFEKLVDGLSHGNRGKFTGIIRCGSDTAKLYIMSNVAEEWTRPRESRFQAWQPKVLRHRHRCQTQGALCPKTQCSAEWFSDWSSLIVGNVPCDSLHPC